MAQIFDQFPVMREKRANGELSMMEPADPSQLAALQLQKRRRLQELNLVHQELVEQREMGKAKRCRIPGAAAAEEENVDIPMYSTRQMQQFEGMKNAEMERLREEAQRYVAGKDEELRAKTEEAQLLLAAATAQKGEIDRLQHENGILKQGVRIQSAAVERVRGEGEERHASEREAFGRAALQAAEHIRRLEQANYALRVQLEQMAPSAPSSNGGGGGFPRWGEGY